MVLGLGAPPPPRGPPPGKAMAFVPAPYQPVHTNVMPPSLHQPFYPTFNPNLPNMMMQPRGILNQVTVSVNPPPFMRPLPGGMLPPPRSSPMMMPPGGGFLPMSMQIPLGQGPMHAQPLQTLQPALVQPPPSLNDPNNDASMWTEHEPEDGRTYWHNRITKVSLSI